MKRLLLASTSHEEAEDSSYVLRSSAKALRVSVEETDVEGDPSKNSADHSTTIVNRQSLGYRRSRSSDSGKDAVSLDTAQHLRCLRAVDDARKSGVLTISSLGLTAVPIGENVFVELLSLQTIDLSNNRLTSVPEGLRLCSNVSK